jgi:hypothetical protein
MTVGFLGGNVPSPAEIQQALKRAVLIIEYESIYEKKWEKWTLNTSEQGKGL